MKDFGRWVREQRLEKGLTQPQLAETTGTLYCPYTGRFYDAILRTSKRKERCRWLMNALQLKTSLR